MSDLSDTLQFIRHHQDGEIAEKIRNSGLRYNMNYGVSSMLLSNFAKAKGRNQELAEQLWKENFREAKLISFMFANPETISNQAIEEYVNGCENSEMVEIGVLHLFSLVPQAIDCAMKWIQNENKYVKMSGYMTIARLAMKKNFVSETQLRDLCLQIEKDVKMDDMFAFQSITRAIQELAFRCNAYKPFMLEKIKYIREQNKGTIFELQTKELLEIVEFC